MKLLEILIAWGIPTGITGFFIWYLKRHIDKREAERRQREENTKEIMLLIMRTSRATNVLAEATAKAVQRIPDAHCNGDMTSALAEAEKIQKEEQTFLVNQGVEHIFG